MCIRGLVADQWTSDGVRWIQQFRWARSSEASDKRERWKDHVQCWHDQANGGASKTHTSIHRNTRATTMAAPHLMDLYKCLAIHFQLSNTPKPLWRFGNFNTCGQINITEQEESRYLGSFKLLEPRCAVTRWTSGCNLRSQAAVLNSCQPE